MMKRPFFILTVLLIWFAIGTVHGTENQHDQLKKQLDTLGHDSTRLKVLTDLVVSHINSPEEHIGYINDLLKEAELQNNQFYIARAYIQFIYSCYNNQDVEGMMQWYNKLEPLARKHGFYDFLFSAKLCVVEMQILNEEYEAAEYTARQMLSEAKKVNNITGIVAAQKSLAGVYWSTYKYKESLEALEEAFKISSAMDNISGRLEVVTYLISLYKHLNDYPNWIKYLRIKEQEIKKEIAKNPKQADSYKGDLLMTYLSYVIYYVYTDQADKAEYYKQLSDQYYCDEYLVYELSYCRSAVAYYQYIKQWDKALEAAQKMADILKEVSYRDYPVALISKAEILYKMGRDEDALKTIKEVLNAKDTLQVSIYNKQIEEIKNNYNANQELLEQSRINRYTKYIVLILVGVLIIVLSYFAYRYYNLQKHLRKTENDIRHVADSVIKSTRAKERFLSNISYAVQIPLNEVVSRSLLLASDHKIDENERTEVSNAIIATSADLMSLIEDILDLSRLEAGKMKFSEQEIDINALMRDMVSISTNIDIECISSFQQSESIFGRVDGQRLADVISSILSGTDKEGRISIEIKEDPEKILSVTASNSILATSEPSQEIIIRNEINRMIIEYLGGTYELFPGSVRFTVKIVDLSHN